MDLLSELITGIPWHEWEDRHDGTIFIKYDMEKPCLPVYMRIGLHLRRPMQVLMAAGKYLRMRAVAVYVNYPILVTLDPDHPEYSLYPVQTWELNTLQQYGRPLWRPFDQSQAQYQAYMQQAQYQQASQLAQHTLQQQQALWQAQGLVGYTTSNTSWPQAIGGAGPFPHR